MMTLPAALIGDRFELSSQSTGRLGVYAAGQGPPLLLVHSVNAAASAAEVRPLFEHYQATRRVYALDLPGFGISERSNREYTPRLMTDAVLAVAQEIRRRHGERAFDALAVSLSSEFLARAAVEHDDWFKSLALVSPTGFNTGRPRRGPTGSTLYMPWLFRALHGPGWGRALFRGLTRPGVIRYFLRRTWGAREIDETLWAYDVITSAQPGAEYAPLYFVAGGLFSADSQRVYEAIQQPVWMSHGVRGDFTDYGAVTIVSGRPNWRISRFATGALPYFEQAREFCIKYDEFLAHTRGPAEAHP